MRAQLPTSVRLFTPGLVALVIGCSQQAAENALLADQSTRPTSQPRRDIVPQAAPPTVPLSEPNPDRQAGIGAALRIENGKVFVTNVLPDTPAARSHVIHPDDQLVAIAEDGKEAVELIGFEDLAAVVGMIRGPMGSIVRLWIVPSGKTESDLFVVSLIRGDIKAINSFVDGRLLPVGTTAPDFAFTRFSNDGPTRLTQLSERIVVVKFWASWCQPCIEDLNSLNSLSASHPEWRKQVELLAVAVDEKQEDAVAIHTGSKWSNVSIVWTGPDVLKLYRVAGLPTTFVIDQQRKIAAADHRLNLPVVINSLLADPKPSLVAAELTPLPAAHAHNDYLHDRPLLDALDHGFTSVESDIFPVAGKLLVGHDAVSLTSRRTLENLYLAPLAERVARNRGHVHAAESRFFLLIDIKRDSEDAYKLLKPLLDKYRNMLTSVENGKLRPRAVTIILTGERPQIAGAEPGPRYVGLDGRLTELESTTPADLMPMISDKWSTRFSWNGDGPMPDQERADLKEMVQQAHAAGRVIRFWATPEKESVWRELRAAGVDLINTDALDRLEFFLRETKPQSEP